MGIAGTMRVTGLKRIRVVLSIVGAGEVPAHLLILVFVIPLLPVRVRERIGVILQGVGGGVQTIPVPPAIQARSKIAMTLLPVPPLAEIFVNMGGREGTAR